MQHDHVLKKLNFALLGGGGGLQAKYLVPFCCNRDSFKFDIQHDTGLGSEIRFDMFHVSYLL